MTAAGADLARAGVGCSGWLFEPVMGSRGKEGGAYTAPLPAPASGVRQPSRCTLQDAWIDGTADAFMSQYSKQLHILPVFSEPIYSKHMILLNKL